MSLINSKINSKISNIRGITFGQLSVGDELHKYVFDGFNGEDSSPATHIVGRICQICTEKIEFTDTEGLAIHYTTNNGALRSRIFVYPDDYALYSNLNYFDELYTSYALTKSEVEDFANSSIDYKESFLPKYLRG